MTPREYKDSCALWVLKELPRDMYEEVRTQYLNAGYYGQRGYSGIFLTSIHEFIKDHRQDLYQQYIAWLTKRKLTDG